MVAQYFSTHGNIVPLQEAGWHDRSVTMVTQYFSTHGDIVPLQEAGWHGRSVTMVTQYSSTHGDIVTLQEAGWHGRSVTMVTYGLTGRWRWNWCRGRWWKQKPLRVSPSTSATSAASLPWALSPHQCRFVGLFCLSAYVSLSVYVCMCLSACPYIYMSVFPAVCMFSVILTLVLSASSVFVTVNSIVEVLNCNRLSVSVTVWKCKSQSVSVTVCKCYSLNASVTVCKCYSLNARVTVCKCYSLNASVTVCK